MYERLRALYLQGRLTDTQLDQAVGKGWVTEEQAQQIRDSTAGTQ